MTTYEQDGYRYWYDTHIRMWTVLTIDENGDQVGHAEYFANRDQLKANYPEFNFKTKIK